jgi:8-oxo-dGTP pyrophosphatase MutT (NUDIX family)
MGTARRDDRALGDPRRAAVRELWEETGQVPDDRVVFVGYAPDGAAAQRDVQFLGHLLAGFKRL